MRQSLPLIAAGVASLAVLAFFLSRPRPPVAPPATPVPTAPAAPPPGMTPLVETPDWHSLEPFQGTIDRATFERLLTTIFTAGEGWKAFIRIDETEARILTGTLDQPDAFVLRFADAAPVPPPAKSWRKARDLSPAPLFKPLDGVRIAIDPGHIGGAWAKMEERWFILGGGTPVTEGDMTLAVARRLKIRLESLGAVVSLVRSRAEPVTPARPNDLVEAASAAGPVDAAPLSIQRLTERLFYRTAEIHARARLVNEDIKPDLVLCLHFNAEGWGNPNLPTLIDRTHFHVLLNGGYNDEEIALPDQRFAMLRKLLDGVHQEEVAVGTEVANTFATLSGLPPYVYPASSRSVRPIAGQPFLWARNLLANRLYHCPVIFMEPYVMNSTIDYTRIQAGDYDGVKEVAGALRSSIFREYSDALTEGLIRYYAGIRGIREESPSRE